MSHNNYNNHPRSSMPSYTSGGSHSGPFLEQGRTITVPPLTKTLLLISDSPGSLSTNVDSTTLNTMSGTNSSPYPVPQRSTPDLAFQRSAPASAQDINATIPNCSCQMCFDAQRRQPTWYANEERDTQQFDVSSLLIMEIPNYIRSHIFLEECWCSI